MVKNEINSIYSYLSKRSQFVLEFALCSILGNMIIRVFPRLYLRSDFIYYVPKWYLNLALLWFPWYDCHVRIDSGIDAFGIEVSNYVNLMKFEPNPIRGKLDLKIWFGRGVYYVKMKWSSWLYQLCERLKRHCNVYRNISK